MNLWAVFLTGLTTGGLSCLALQGGLLASVIANQKESVHTKNLSNNSGFWFDKVNMLPVSLFLIAKLLAHGILGFLLGWLGTQLELSISVRLVFQGIAALFMLATAGNLLNLHPLFRYVAFQPPRYFYTVIKSSTKSKALFAPAVLGFLTVLIPCGVTQAMEVLAITSGSPLTGALIMIAFTAGTSPLFALVGMATAQLSDSFQQTFMKAAAILLLFLGASSLNGILVVVDSPLTFSKIIRPVTYFFSDDRFVRISNSAVTPATGTQNVLIKVKSNGYSPNKVSVRAGQPVQLTLQTEDTYSCASSFILKKFNITMQLSPTDTQTVLFTPTEKGKYPFSCSMGMYTGILEVL